MRALYWAVTLAVISACAEQSTEAFGPAASPDIVSASVDETTPLITQSPIAESSTDFSVFTDVDVVRVASRWPKYLSNLDVTEERFIADGISLGVTIANRSDEKPGPTFVIIHDSEDEAFVAGISSVHRHGGKLIALENNEERCVSSSADIEFANGQGICGAAEFDPNRIVGNSNFREFSAFWESQLSASTVVIALHNNGDAYKNAGGIGSMSILKTNSFRNNCPAYLEGGTELADDEDNVVLMSALTSYSPSHCDAAIAKAINTRGAHFMHSNIARYINGFCPSSCGLNKFVLNRLTVPYYNIEVQHVGDFGDVQVENLERQIEIVDVLIEEAIAK